MKNYPNKWLSLLLLVLIFQMLFVSCLKQNSSSNNQNIIDTAESYDDLSSFVSMVDSAQLTSALSTDGPFTVFAPVNDAFSQIPDSLWETMSTEELKEIIEYHTINNELYINSLLAEQTITSSIDEDLFVVTDIDSVHINAGKVVGFNIPASNGVIHATDKVLFPDSYLNIIQIVAKRYNLSAFKDSLKNTDLPSTLEQNTNEGYTLFAPSDSAIENGNLANNQLGETLAYHVIPQKLLSEDLTSQTYETLNGEEISIEEDGDAITINGEATITSKNLDGTNGVVHIIDALLNLPTE